MIEVKDRVPMYPGRVKLIPVSGQANTYDLVRADEPIEAGTPINRALFLSLLDDINAIRQQLDDKIFEMSQRTEIGLLSDGTIFGLYENGVLVPYIKLQNTYNAGVSAGAVSRAVVVRLDCVTTMSFRDSNQGPVYNGSNIDLWLQNEFIPMLDATTQSVLQEVSVHWSNATDTVQGIQRKVFILSVADYNHSNLSGFPAVGYSMQYFSSNDRRISRYNGTPIQYYTRTVHSTGNKVAVIRADGTAAAVDATTVAGVRPAFTLPLTFEVTVGVPSQENVMATAEVI